MDNNESEVMHEYMDKVLSKQTKLCDDIGVSKLVEFGARSDELNFIRP